MSPSASALTCLPTHNSTKGSTNGALAKRRPGSGRSIHSLGGAHPAGLIGFHTKWVLRVIPSILCE
eukprot:scaffold2033_cov367-Prasinococcus_capsulatus_cf.AAC.12